MRRIVFVAVILAVAIGAWLSFSDRGAPPDVAPVEGDSGPVGPGVRAPVEGPAPLKGAPPPTTRVQPRRGPTSVEVKVGSLVVRVVPEGEAAVPPTIRVDVESLGRALSAHPLAEHDEKWVVHRYASLPVGSYRVRVMAEGFQDATADVTVSEDAEATTDVPLRAGATAAYAVALPDGSAPETVTIALLDGRGKPLPYTAQTLATTLHTTPDRPVGLPAKGRLIGLRPGKYTLRATSPAGQIVDREFEAKVGEEATLEVSVAK